MKAKKQETWAKTVTKRVAGVRKDAEKQIRTGMDRALNALPPAPRKAVKEFTANVEKTQNKLVKRAEGLAKDMRKRAEGLVKDFSKRAEGVLKTVNKRTEGVTATIEKRFDGVVKPLTKRLDVASRSEVDRLRKRIEHLERRIETKSHSPAPVTETAAA